MERRLAAVLAADVAGYSRLMGIDEEGTLAKLKAVRKALVDPTITAHRGRIVKTTGDGMLVEFASAVDAARSAVEIQRGMAGQNDGVPRHTRIEFRIGIHVGDIIFDDNDIFGDGVNIAARLEGIAEPGGVCMSDDAYRQVRGKIEPACDDMGPQALKNITEPMRAWRVQICVQSAATAQANSPASQAPALDLPDKPSIAVLPFQNMSGDPEQEYFADGMVEDIITALSRFKSLFVIARNSSFTYKGKAVDIKQVGRELGVRYVLEGSVRKAGGKVRITGQLIDAATGAHLWADRFDGSLEDVFDLQDKVTEQVVGVISPKIQQAEIDRAKLKRTDSLDAYDCYIRGLENNHLVSFEGNRAALDFCRQAIELDPSFVPSYSLAARCFTQNRAYGWARDEAQETADGSKFAKFAVAIGQGDADALSAAANFYAFVLHDLDTAANLVEQAVSLNPNMVDAWRVCGWISVWQGRHDVAISQIDKALRLSPIEPLIYSSYGAMAAACCYRHQYPDALLWAAKALARQPNFVPSLRVSIIAHVCLDQLEEARTLMLRPRIIEPDMTISRLRKWLPNRRPEDIALHIAGMRAAGMPE